MQENKDEKHNTDYWKNNLELQSHDEGGLYKELYRSDQLQEYNGKQRQALSAIYYYLEKDKSLSLFHQHDTRELFIYQHGDPMELCKIMPDGTLTIEIVGPELDKGQTLINEIGPGIIFASRTLGKYTLFQCICYPAFEFEGFKLLKKKEMLEKYPQHKDYIDIYARE